jgi:NAD(P)-dependent dehydrogenase (short-subunit alcohol dehydrogenase family)
MTTSLAYEWATYGIRLNAVAPGPFPTKGAWDRLVPNKNLEETFKARVPMGRFGNPEELANLAAFLLSDMAPYITGECVTIDGGERLNAGQFNFVAQAMPREELKTFLKTFRKERPRA